MQNNIMATQPTNYRLFLGKLLQRFKRPLTAVAYLLLSLSSLSVFGQQGGVMLTISNDTPNNLLVTMYDMGTTPRQLVLSSRLINGNGSITVSVSQDTSGKGRVWWTAMNLDRDMRKCGHGDMGDLNDGDTVNVFVEGDCSE
jgi:hypothetical protein